jgi:hypothetical protein
MKPTKSQELVATHMMNKQQPINLWCCDTLDCKNYATRLSNRSHLVCNEHGKDALLLDFFVTFDRDGTIYARISPAGDAEDALSFITKTIHGMRKERSRSARLAGHK